MKVTGIHGLQGLEKLRTNIQNRSKILSDLSGSRHDLSQVELSSGPVLHQSTKDASEEQLAQFEMDNPQIVAFLQAIKLKLEKELKK